MGPSPIEVSFWRRRQRGAVPGEGLEPRVRPWNLEGEHRAKQTPRAEGAWPVERPGGPAWLERESGRGGVPREGSRTPGQKMLSLKGHGKPRARVYGSSLER